MGTNEEEEHLQDTSATNEASARPKLAGSTSLNEYGFQAALNREQVQQLDSLRPNGSRNHLQGNYTTSTNLQNSRSRERDTVDLMGFDQPKS
jgi:hypothetical protein